MLRICYFDSAKITFFVQYCTFWAEEIGFFSNNCYICTDNYE